MKNFKIIIVLLIISTIISCQPNDQPANNGLAVEQSSVNADFTISIVAGSDNKFVLKAASTNVLSNQWNLNDGNQPFVGTSTQEIFLPFAGTYEIEHTTVSKGGAYNKTTQNVTVNSSDPLFGNLVQGGNFATADDLSKWEILRIAGTHVNWTFADGFATVKGSHPSNYGQQGIFQAIDVVANKKYKVDMTIKGSAGTSCWFEVHVGTAVPAQNEDYGTATTTQRLKISTFDNCTVMNSVFNGQLLALNCFTPVSNTMKFNQTGKVYLVIRAGGFDNNTLGTNGVSITNVKFFPVI